MRIVVLFIMLLSGFCYADVFKWIDEKGRVHFSDQLPENTQVEEVKLEVNTYTQVSFDVTTSEKANDVNLNRTVVMYSTQWCGYCQKARSYFNANNILFTEYDIEKSHSARIRYDKMGAKGVPVILVGNKRMNGFSPQGFSRIYQ